MRYRVKYQVCYETWYYHGDYPFKWIATLVAKWKSKRSRLSRWWLVEDRRWRTWNYYKNGIPHGGGGFLVGGPFNYN